MNNFKEWFVINENKEEKALALELAGDIDVINQLSSIIPQGKRDTDKLLLLAAYYYSKNKNLEEIKTEMSAYIGYVVENKMELITVDVISKKPDSPWNSYIYWTQIIHAKQGNDEAKNKSSYKVSDSDFEGEVPFLTSSDGKIKVYKGNSPQQCIILGRGESFCISRPGSINWQIYRADNISTFYFVYDSTRNDRLSIVIIDKQAYKTELTDKVNNTGVTLDPYTGEETEDPESYMRYLKEKGIDISEFVNIPRSDKEIEEQNKLGAENKKLDWFISLSHDEKSKYIGRGHRLSDEQFDYLLEHKLKSLLMQYMRIGLKLNDYQLDKVATNRDLRDKYLHNRLIKNIRQKDLTKKEFDLLKPEQKKNVISSLHGAIIFGQLKDVKNCIDQGQNVDYSSLGSAIVRSNNLDIIEYLVDEKGIRIDLDLARYAVSNGLLIFVKYFLDKKPFYLDYKIFDFIANAAARGHLNIIKYLLDEKKLHASYDIMERAVENAASGGHLDVVKYFMEEKGLNISGDVDAKSIQGAKRNNHLNVVEYLTERSAKKRASFATEGLFYGVKNGQLDLVKYYVDQGAKIDNLIFNVAAAAGHFNIVKYLLGNEVELEGEKIKLPSNVKPIKIREFAVKAAEKNGHQNVAEYLKTELAKM